MLVHKLIELVLLERSVGPEFPRLGRINFTVCVEKVFVRVESLEDGHVLHLSSLSLPQPLLLLDAECSLSEFSDELISRGVGLGLCNIFPVVEIRVLRFLHK